MRSYLLLKQNFKCNCLVLIFFTILLGVCIVAGIQIQRQWEGDPQKLLLSDQFLAIKLWIPMFYIVIVFYRSVTKRVDSGSIVYFLSVGYSRKKILRTTVIYLIGSLLFMTLFMTVVELICGNLLFAMPWANKANLLFNGRMFLVYLLIGAICFIVSCLAREKSVYLLFGILLPAMFLGLVTLGSVSDQVDLLRFGSVFTGMDPRNIVQGGSGSVVSLLLSTVITIILYLTGIKIFEKRDLPH